MIESLSVKNFALIKEAHIDFKNNLNILTGETGSGKSILLGSINLALGKRISKDYIRNDNDEASVSICFNISDDLTKEFIKSLDIELEDNRVIVYRKITKDKNVVKINDVPCTLAKLKELTEKLIDIYGQHDGEDLRKNAKHIDFLDSFIGKEVVEMKSKIAKCYENVKSAKEKLMSFNLDENMRLREIDILKYEIDELNNADIKEGEEEELSEKYKLVSASKNILSSLSNAYNSLQNIDVGLAIREVKDALKHDSDLQSLYNSLMDVDAIISDSVKELDKKISIYDIDDSELNDIETRLNLIRGILAKYNNSFEYARSQLDKKAIRLAELEDYENEKNKAEETLENYKNDLAIVCESLTKLRKSYITSFIDKLTYELKDLGFLDVNFDISLTNKSEPTRDGNDDVVFYVSLNKGEKLRPLSEVASGGELSRIMLSIKTILSDSYDTETLIFDEIDAGISGITASKVASKLNKISKNHQVILITHLPQIAAMADNHYVIMKDVIDDRTFTSINELDADGMISEIGRLISTSGELTDNVIANAKELKANAMKEKG